MGDQAVSSDAACLGQTPHPGDLERPLLRILDLDQAMHVERLGPKARARRIRAELDMSAIVFYHHRWTALVEAYCWVERPAIMQRLVEDRRRITVERRRLIEEIRRVG